MPTDPIVIEMKLESAGFLRDLARAKLKAVEFRNVLDGGYWNRVAYGMAVGMMIAALACWGLIAGGVW